MKKILTILCAFLMMLVLPTNIFADEDIYEVSTEKTQNIELVANKTATYSVKIPKSVDVSDDEKTFEVLACGNISSDQKLCITFDDDNCALVDQANVTNKQEDVEVSVEIDDGEFVFTELKATYAETNKKVTFTVTHETISAGSYKAVLPITISLNSL